MECLESLWGIIYPNFSVYVADNASSDESVSRLARFTIHDSRLTFIQNKENIGFAGGNNIGIKKALEDGAEYILLLNNDTLAHPPKPPLLEGGRREGEPDFLGKLVEVAESDPQIGIVGPKIYFVPATTHNPQPTTNNEFSAKQKIWFGGGKLNWLKTRGAHVDYEKIETLNPKPYNLKPRDSDYITGCCLLIKREVINKIGLMPEEYFLYYEDVDWCLKAHKAGYRIAYVPQAHIWHKISRSTQAGSSSYIYYHVRNGLMLAWRYGTFFTRLVLPFFILWTLAKQIIKLCIPSKRLWALATLKGVGDFFRGGHGKQNSA